MKKILITGVILLLGAIWLIVFWTQNSKPVITPDLDFKRPNIPNDQNAFFHLEKAYRGLDLSDADRLQVLANLYDGKWDAETVEAILGANNTALALFRQHAASPTLLVPQIQQIPSIENPLKGFEYLESWKNLALLHALHARSLFEGGGERESFEELLAILKIGHQMQDSGGGLIHYVYSASTKRIAIQQLPNMIGTTSLPTETLLSFGNRLEVFRANLTGLSNAVKMEFEWNVAVIDAIASGDLSIPGASGFGSSLMGKRPVLNRKETIHTFSEFAQVSLDSVNLYFSDMPVCLAAVTLHPTNRASVPKLMLSGNATGKILSWMLLPSHARVFAFKSEQNSSISAIQTLIALRYYKETHGTLPETLNALVPEYLPSLPIDDFDGKPLRYSVEKKVIYSIGKDLEDSGGVEKLDLVFPIRF
ncbi:MAG: hypothetical protein H0X66_15720 [Verrucomicrobia bacterium]|nr:hypothetical protein [Verrucomicrobiota bacterium]